MFISLDGEGIGDKLVLFCAANSDGSVKRSIESENGLSTVACLDFLFDLAEEFPDAKFIGFSFSYDVNMILYPTLGNVREYAKRLAKQKRVRFKVSPKRHIEVKLYGRKMTIFREFTVDDNGKKKPSRTIKIDDVFGFYQSSFLKALQKEGMADAEVIARIESGKNHRAGGFDGMISDEVKRYCFDECMSLSQMVEKLANAIASAGLKEFKHYHGAGAIAQAFMHKYHVQRHVIHDEVFGSEIQNVIRYGYFGGRTECWKQGYFDNRTFQYDINSAYPTETLTLPSLRGGYWTELVGPSDKLAERLQDLPYALCHVTWDCGKPKPHMIVPFPVRYEDDTVHWIRSGNGWYWTPEVLAALRNMPDVFRIDKILAFIPAKEYTQPFSFVDQIARLRFQAKAAGLASEKVYKLGLNSLYGKCAQRQYGKRVPPFQSLVWAGLITSGTRAKLLDIIVPHNESLIAVATDGVLFDSDPNLPTGDGLGELDKKEYSELLYLQPGVYFVDGEQGTPKTRGHLLADLKYADILAGWQEHGPNFEYEYVSRRFVALGLANHWQRWEDWCQWIDFPRTVRCKIRDKLPHDIDFDISALMAEVRNPTGKNKDLFSYVHDGRNHYDLCLRDPKDRRNFRSFPYMKGKVEQTEDINFDTPSLLQDFVASTQPALPTLF